MNLLEGSVALCSLSAQVFPLWKHRQILILQLVVLPGML